MGVFAPPSLLPTSPVCACVAEERKRWDVVIVTVSRYSGGEMWCLCRVSLALCDEAESGSGSHGRGFRDTGGIRVDLLFQFSVILVQEDSQTNAWCAVSQRAEVGKVSDGSSRMTSSSLNNTITPPPFTFCSLLVLQDSFLSLSCQEMAGAHLRSPSGDIYMALLMDACIRMPDLSVDMGMQRGWAARWHTSCNSCSAHSSTTSSHHHYYYTTRGQADWHSWHAPMGVAQTGIVHVHVGASPASCQPFVGGSVRLE
ncbi:hypothetical protein NQZ68_019030 [Dissostichus eleginoides]|nr:hypothetical protein NQZ68_019030 [Dissostichus eleginoides]